MSNGSTWEKTLVLLKTDAVQRALLGTIIERFEHIGLTITAMKLLSAPVSTAEKHYEEHRGKPYFKPLVGLLTSGPILILCLEGAHAVQAVRKTVGATEPLEAVPGSIRGDFCHMSYARSKERLGVIPNLVHASDSPESASRELAVWFSKDDYVKPYNRVDSQYM